MRKHFIKIDLFGPKLNLKTKNKNFRGIIIDNTTF